MSLDVPPSFGGQGCRLRSVFSVFSWFLGQKPCVLFSLAWELAPFGLGLFICPIHLAVTVHVKFIVSVSRQNGFYVCGCRDLSGGSRPGRSGADLEGLGDRSGPFLIREGMSGHSAPFCL